MCSCGLLSFSFKFHGSVTAVCLDYYEYEYFTSRDFFGRLFFSLHGRMNEKDARFVSFYYIWFLRIPVVLHRRNIFIAYCRFRSYSTHTGMINTNKEALIKNQLPSIMGCRQKHEDPSICIISRRGIAMSESCLVIKKQPSSQHSTNVVRQSKQPKIGIQYLQL